VTMRGRIGEVSWIEGDRAVALLPTRTAAIQIDTSTGQFLEDLRGRRRVGPRTHRLPRGRLTGPTELAQLQGQLALESARRDLEAVARERAHAADLEDARAEVARLRIELQIDRL